MKEMAHTPGPWVLDEHLEPNGNCLALAVMTGQTFIADVHFADEWDAEAAANARLIASATEMVDALLRLEPYLDAIVCYASTMDEHAPNKLASDVRGLLARFALPTQETKTKENGE